MAGRPSIYLKCRHNYLQNFIVQLNSTGRADITLSNILVDVQKEDETGYLQNMMKSQVFVDIDRTQRSRFYLQGTKGLVESDAPFVVGLLRNRLLKLFREDGSYPVGEHTLIENLISSVGSNPDIVVLEFMGYRKPVDGSLPVAVTLAACLFSCTKSSGAVIFYISVSSMPYSRRQFGSTGGKAENNLGFRRRKIASLLLSLVQAISYISSHSLLIGAYCSTDTFVTFYNKKGFEYTLNSDCWPKALAHLLAVHFPDAEGDKIQCILYKLVMSPLQLLVGDVDRSQNKDLDILQRLNSGKHGDKIVFENEMPLSDDVSEISIVLPPSLIDEDDVIGPMNKLPAEDDCSFSERLNSIYNTAEDIPCEVNNNEVVMAEEPNSNTADDILCEVNNNEVVMAEETNSTDDAEATTGDVDLELDSNGNEVATELDPNSTTPVLLYESGSEPSNAALRYSDDNIAACGNDIESENNNQVARGKVLIYESERESSNVALRSSDENVAALESESVDSTVRHSTLTRRLKSRRLYEAVRDVTNVNYCDSDDEYYFDEDIYTSIKDINPRDIQKKRKLSKKGDAVDQFYKFLTYWTHLMYLRNQQFENKRYTGYVGIGTDNSGRKVRLALTVAYVELTSGLTQGFLVTAVKSNPGFQVELSKDFINHTRKYAKCWSGKQECEIYLKLWQHEWTHIRFFKDPNNLGNNRFQLRNINNNLYMDFVPKVWFFECLSPETNIEKQLANKLIKDCKKERGNRWQEIPPGNSSKKVMVPTNDKELFRIRVKQPAGIQSCLFTSLANGFYFIGDEKTGQLIESHANYSLQKNDRFKYAIELTRNKVHRYNPIKYIGQAFDIFNNTSEWPTLCVLLGDDFSQNHAVTVVNNWILDSNADFAMELTQENLDWSVSTATQSVHFVKVVKVARFVQYKKQKFMLEEKSYMV